MRSSGACLAIVWHIALLAVPFSTQSHAAAPPAKHSFGISKAALNEERPGDRIRWLNYYATKASWDNLESQSRSANDHVATNARWQLYLRQIKLAKPESKVACSERLFGWIEGRFGVEVPDWWRLVILSEFGNIPLSPEGRTGSRGESLASLFIRRGKRTLFDPLPYTLSDYNKDVDIPKGTELFFTATGIVFRQGGHSVTVPRNALVDIHNKFLPFNRFRFVIAESQLYLIAPGPGKPGYPIVKIDPAAGQVLWINHLWEGNVTGPLSATGPRVHNTDLRLSQNKIIVFGWVLGGPYFEVFDRRTGQCDVRLGTTNWFFDPKLEASKDGK